MGVYHNVNENINTIQDFVYNNENVKRYLFYNDTPLDPSKSIPTIPQIRLNNFYPYPNNPEPVDDAKSFINVYMFDGSNSGSNNIYQRDVNIYVDILCHETLWLLDDESGLTRPLEILDILDTSIPLLSTPSIRTKMVFKGSRYIQYNSKFCGYRLIYEITNQSRDCR